jgi:hypothetical protein
VRKRPARETDPSPPSGAEVLKQSRDIPLLSLRAFVAYEKGETYLFYYRVSSKRYIRVESPGTCYEDN